MNQSFLDYLQFIGMIVTLYFAYKLLKWSISGCYKTMVKCAELQVYIDTVQTKYYEPGEFMSKFDFTTLKEEDIVQRYAMKTDFTNARLVDEIMVCNDNGKVINDGIILCSRKGGFTEVIQLDQMHNNGTIFIPGRTIDESAYIMKFKVRKAMPSVYPKDGTFQEKYAFASTQTTDQ